MARGIEAAAMPDLVVPQHRGTPRAGRPDNGTAFVHRIPVSIPVRTSRLPARSVAARDELGRPRCFIDIIEVIVDVDDETGRGDSGVELDLGRQREPDPLVRVPGRDLL